MPKQSEPQLIPLAILSVGSRARISRLNGGPQFARRLLSLGLRIGSEVTVLQHRGHGVVVASQGARVALGAGVAEKLLMLPLEMDAED